MCLILFAVAPNDDFQLVVAANRDEQYARPTAQAAHWNDHPSVLAGRDLEAGGTWLGVTETGRFAAVTNFREDPPNPLPPRSRGELTANFLTGTESCETYLEGLDPIAQEFRGFNLLVADGNEHWYYSNREGIPRKLAPGFYGLSNQLLDCDWPKVRRGRKQLLHQVSVGFDTNDLFELLFCKGDGKPFSQSFIATERYGTSASTVVTIGSRGDIEFEERNFLPWGEPHRIHRYRIAA
jgi:uncharacterized protein with NRDE domain